MKPANRDLTGAQFRNAADYHERIAKADALLTESRVAVYPIDVRGLWTTDLSRALRRIGRARKPDEIAHETGGRAFVGTNDFGGAIKKSHGRRIDLLHRRLYSASAKRKE